MRNQEYKHIFRAFNDVPELNRRTKFHRQCFRDKVCDNASWFPEWNLLRKVIPLQQQKTNNSFQKKRTRLISQNVVQSVSISTQKLFRGYNVGNMNIVCSQATVFLQIGSSYLPLWSTTLEIYPSLPCQNFYIGHRFLSYSHYIILCFHLKYK